MATISNPAGPANATILGIGSYRPSRVIPNADIIAAIDSSDEWIQQRSGIKQRRWAAEHETVQMMSVEASRKAIASAGLDVAQIDAIVVATVSHMGVEKLSDLTDVGDRGTAFIFADGAGAVVVGPSDEPGIGPVVWGSDGEQFDLIRQREDWRDVIKMENPTMPHLMMQGNPVFRWASFEMAKIAHATLDRSGLTVDDLDVFVPHQANMRIIDAMARSMKLPPHVKIARDIAEQGNTSAASIPLALDRMIEEGEARSGDTALLIAFGAGLAYAAQVVTVP